MDRKKQIKNMSSKGVTYREIGSLFGISFQRVHQIVKNYNRRSDFNIIWTKMRDGFKCLVCDSKNNLEVHHIDNNKRNDKPENLATLCRKCHYKIESIDYNSGLKNKRTYTRETVDKNG